MITEHHLWRKGISEQEIIQAETVKLDLPPPALLDLTPTNLTIPIEYEVV